ncbi:MAG: T9SS type A sorting domain-containing protein [Ignavibacteriae bacterium]|nr:T9SS type A sorting domain-containing protein [Ignavibacteriota bacterium]
MRIMYKAFLMTLFLGVIFTNTKAQSELVVEWADANGDVVVNALYDAITNDTLRPDDRVYKLRAGGYYWNSERIDNNGFHLRIIGEEPDPTDELKNPAVIQMIARTDGSTTDGIIRGYSDITLKNVWMTGAFAGTGTQTTYQPFQMDATNSTFIFDNCIFDRSNFAMIAFTNSGNDITITNCKFRNLIGRPSTQQWEGRGVSIWADQKSVVVENCTFFNLGFTAIQIESGAAKYVRIVHNTFVNVGRIILQSSWWRDAYIANNVIVNGFWHAEGYIDYTSAGRDPRGNFPGYFNISALPSMYGPEEGRRFLLTNTSAYTAPEFTSYYADSLLVGKYIGVPAKEDFIDKYETMRIFDTLWVDPGMPTNTTENYPNMIQNIQDLRAGITPAHEWFWNLPVFEGVECYECVSWPLPENFKYTNTSLMTASTNGLPLGDLNWFPESKAIWEANHDEYVSYIESLAGEVINYDLVDEAQAEDGTLTNGAEVETAQGLSYYEMNSGFIEWTFDVAEAGQYDINLYVNLKGRGTSGVNFFVNGFEIHDPRGWGQYVFGNDGANTTVNAGFDINNWGWWLVKQEEIKEVIDNPSLTPLYLNAGTNVIQIKASWCDNKFGGFELRKAGTTDVVLSLKGADVTAYSVAKPVLEGAAWAPQWFKSVALNGGSATVNFNAPTDGDYVIQAFYQNYNGPSTGNVLVDGTVAVSFDYNSDPDSVGLSGLSTAFPLTAGTHAIGLSGTGVNLDLVQLIKKSVAVGIEEEMLPEGYSLTQNYPNPFNPSTQINFSIGKANNVKLFIYNVLGQKVATLLNKNLKAGTHTVNFNAHNLSSGVYFYGIEAGEFKLYKKMMLLK